MVNLDSYIYSRRIQFIYRIINEPIENWNAIGKYCKSQSMNCFEFSSHMSWIVFILLLKNEENIKRLFWKVILQFPNNLTKKCIPKDYLKFLKNENIDIDNKTKSRNKMKLLNNLKLTDIRGKIINTKDK
jgi:hypothetical protein